MKRLGGLWTQVVDFNNLLLAFKKAARGKRSRHPVSRFALRLEHDLFRLQEELQSGSYTPGKYQQFTIYDRKPRLISAAPFRDRVVHHAVMNIIEPPLDRYFIYDSYACRKGKGVHAAVDRYQTWAQRYPYVLKMDIASYFPSIDHELLIEKLERKIKCRRTLGLLRKIITCSPPSGAPPRWIAGDDLFEPLSRGRGIPIGNLTSQFFANLYLNDLDHYIKQVLGVKAYLRYVDDTVALGDSTSQLREWRELIDHRVTAERLRLHARKREISRTIGGVDVLGYRIFPHRRRIRNDNAFRFHRRLRAFASGYSRGRLDFENFNPSVQSWIGHAKHGETLSLRRKAFADVVFTRGSGHTKPSA